MSRSKVSVIIPTCNRASLLRESIDAVLADLQPGDELLVVDDGSSDDTVDVLKSYGSALRFVSTPNQGKSAALNLGLELTDNPLVWIVDDDDLILPGARQTLVSLIEDDGVDIAYGRYDRFVDRPGEARKMLGTGYWADCEPDDVLLSTLQDLFIHQPGMMVKRSLYQKVGPFDEALTRSVDYEMEVRLLQQGSVAGTNEVLFLQRVHDGLRGRGNSQISNRNQAWIDSDKAIFRAVRYSIPLASYVPSKEISKPSDNRLALLNRAVVYARKKIWAWAIQDFASAAELTREPLSSEERSIIRKAVFSKYGCDELIEDDAIIELLFKRLQGSAPGKQILASLARGLMHHVRRNLQSGNLRTACRYTLLIMKLLSRSKSAAKQMVMFELLKAAPNKFVKLRKFRSVLGALPFPNTRQLVTQQFYDRNNRAPDLDRPKGLSEKINYMRLRGATSLQTQCADKIRVRSYAKETIGERYLNKAILCTYDLADINPNMIKEERFVLKTNHDQGGVILCRDRSSFDWLGAQMFLAEHLSYNHWHRHHEPAYRDIKPGILVEEFLGDQLKTPKEYKLFCFHGQPAFIMAMGQQNGARTKTLYDLNWRRLPFKRFDFETSEKELPRPAHLHEMLNISGRLSKPFKFCRVDLYSFNGALRFGELTFTPDAGLTVFEPAEWEDRLGELLSVSPPSLRHLMGGMKLEH
ncbi:MAG: ATP-grasp fold amidoligase family protein [Pseudomonadota bacterium]